ncbi:GATA zinc finger domain-containing protein 14-like isoform X1 [Pieris napi]|uniref:GATA zinc finger domain-containing protein 14-like isoform X1 n=1 Tax=Pieris napi TaxID=78633 RepID=UPI001FBA0286|nr:GATA zinc finger domain-containing protein 14-like isoform X1 [Pieris napi]
MSQRTARASHKPVFKHTQTRHNITMFLPIYTLAAIANIVAKSHNYNIDHELNPYLRVKKSISDVKVKDIEHIYPVESDQSEQNRHSAINKENQLKYSTVHDPDELNFKDQSREKRSYYIPISRPIEDSSTSIPTITKDVSSTSDLNDIEPTTTTTDSSYSDYNVDYENGGNFIFKNQLGDTNKNKTDKYPNNGLNNSTNNNTQAYYPLSHTFIPGYNEPKDVFDFEKGPVYTNSTDTKTNAEQENEEFLKENDDKNNERIKRSYYIAKSQSSKPGNAQSYYPLSHTYIPGYNTQEGVYDFDRGQVLPISKNITSDTPNKSKETKPQEKEDPHKNDDRTQRTTTKRPTTKHNLERMTRSPQPLNWKHNEDYDDYTQLQPKNKRPAQRESQNPTNLDYDNDGEFIVYRPKSVNRVKPKQAPRRKPTNTPHTGKHPKPHTTKQPEDSDSKESEENMDTYYRRGSGRRHAITRIKRSYYMPTYEYDNYGRKKINGYRPLSHTYIPGYNEQEDVWRYEGGEVYPYPSNGGGDIDNTGTQRGQGNKKHKTTNEDETRNKKHKSSKDKKDESLLDKIIINPIKKLFGYRKKRNTNIDIPNNTIIVRKRNGVTDFLNNMVDKIHNYTRRDQVIIIDENNIHNGKTNENYLSSVPDPYGNGYDDIAYPNNPYYDNRNHYNTQDNRYDNRQYRPYQHKANRGFSPYQNGYQYPTRYNYNQRSYQKYY